MKMLKEMKTFSQFYVIIFIYNTLSTILSALQKIQIYLKFSFYHFYVLKS